MNPSPLGGFAEGIAGGVRGATALMVQGHRLKVEKEEHAANMRMNIGFKFFEILKGNPEAQTNVLKEYIMPAFVHYSKKGGVKYSEVQITNLFDNLDLTNEKGKTFMATALNIFKEYRAGKLNSKEALDAFDAIVGTYQGELTGRQEDYLKHKRAQHVAESRRKKITALVGDMPGKEGKPGQPTPLMSGLTEGYGKAAAGGIAAAMKADIPFHQATGAFPKKKAKATPTTPMYKDKQLPDGRIQAMQWNPKTQEHDIPFGEPKAAKDGHYFRLGHNYYRIKNGKSVMIQEGSVDEKATMNAMKEFGWPMMSEPEQVAAVAKHKRILTGKSKPASKKDTERGNAEAAIAAGVDAAAVKAMYKQRTGKEF